MTRKKLLLKRAASIILSLVCLTIVAMPAIGLAQSDIDWGIGYTDEIGLPTTDVRIVIVRIIKALLGFLGVAALIIILIGGVEWMTAGGNDDKVKTAQKRIGYGVIGIVIIFVAYALTVFVFDVIWSYANQDNYNVGS